MSYGEAFDITIRAALSHIPEQMDPKSSVIPSWYVRPCVHVVLILVVNILFGTIVQLSRRRLTRSTPARKGRGLADVVDAVATTVLLAAFVCVVVSKIADSKAIFLLQPCHVLTLAIFLCTLRPASALTSFLFNFMISCGLWSVALGMLFADFRDYHRRIDIAVFWIHHSLVLGIPVMWIVTRKIQVYQPPLWSTVFNHAWVILYHWDVLLVMSMISGANLNYMMTPPPGPLMRFGRQYHVAQIFISFFLTVAARMVFVPMVMSFRSTKKNWFP
eukprot:NODE_2085_length_990_cov_95.876727_g1705_i0.p1 GENE.NODE_2085_length_990_cov_95.876727_g1705_i0~~NODE_2085_length_990_cov_95.876727_g1705_i0.p1  ORF type:complete len:274 (+),score=36.03 NODE_2085_length_990_cov_95.876727_g1705_i0:127-948(+)